MKAKIRRLPTTAEAIIFMIILIAVIVTAVRMNLGGGGAANAVVALLIGTILTTIFAFFLGNKWDEIQESMIGTIKEIVFVFMLISIIGMMIGVWMIGGTVPALIYYGLKLINPYIMLPLTFFLCVLTSLFTGTSFGTLATMGLALVSVSKGMGMPVHIVAGAAVSGAYFGDKMSPLSDSTLMSSGLTQTPLYSHIYSMFYTTIPAAIVCIVVYSIMGFKYASGNLDLSSIVEITAALEGNFNLSLLTLIPPVLVILISARRIPAIPGLTVCLFASVILAILLQGQPLIKVLTTSFRGFVSNTDVKIVDSLLSRGGLKSIQDTLSLMLFACMMGGALHQSGAMNVFSRALLKVLKKPSSLILGTMLYNYILVFLSGTQGLTIIMSSRTFKDVYNDMDLHSRVLSRTIEDTATIGVPIVPWGTATIFACTVMGVTTAYIPYAFLSFTVPVFSIICALTGYGLFRADGSRMWGKKSGR